jgi:hypothetical protein
MDRALDSGPVRLPGLPQQGIDGSLDLPRRCADMGHRVLHRGAGVILLVRAVRNPYVNFLRTAEYPSSSRSACTDRGALTGFSSGRDQTAEPKGQGVSHRLSVTGPPLPLTCSIRPPERVRPPPEVAHRWRCSLRPRLPPPPGVSRRRR